LEVLVLRKRAILLAGLLAWIIPVAQAQAPGQPVKGQSSEEEKKIAGQLDLATASLLHNHLEVLCDKASLEVSYGGPLGRKLKARGLRFRPESIGGASSWHVHETNGLGVPQLSILFTIAVSLEKAPDTLASCKVNGKQLFLRVSYPGKDATLDSKPGGGKLSIRELVQLLDGKEF
jgi:hypothetical protein